jgi:hypothetical protein
MNVWPTLTGSSALLGSVQATGFSLSLGRPEGRPLQRHKNALVGRWPLHRINHQNVHGSS